MFRDDRSLHERFRRWRKRPALDRVTEAYGNGLWSVIFAAAKVAAGLFCLAALIGLMSMVVLAFTS